MALLVGEVLRRNAQVVPRLGAATLGDRRMNYAELNAQGNRVAHALRALGVAHGDRVACWSNTTLDVLPLYVALSKLGAVFAPLNARFGTEEASDILGLARPRMLVVDAEHAGAGEVVAKAADVERLARVGGGPGPGVDLAEAARAASASEPETPELVETDPHVIFFTSGSTGRPKGVVLSHRVNYLRTMRGQVERMVSMFPLFHMAGWMYALGAWQGRGEVNFVESPTAEGLLDAVQKYRPMRLYCIPGVWPRILEHDLSRWDLSSLQGVDTGTSATPPELIAALKERFPGTTTNIMYGSTEAGPGTILADPDVLRKPGSVGLPAPGVDLRITDAGEVCLRSDLLMSGYFENPKATAEALVDGWYHTGDLGLLDDEGYLSIVGRKREIIRSGGETVAPTEVEAALADHPDIAEVAVVGIPDARWGEVVCAVVVPRAERVPSIEELREHCAARLAHYKQPRRVEGVAELPRTPATGQIQRNILVEQITSSSPESDGA